MLVLYAIVRSVVEIWRNDDRGVLFGWLSTSQIISVPLFALGIGVSLALHEAGHLVAGKAFGMKVRRYFVGYGPTLFSFRRGETEYGLKALPFGGFCDIAGMTTLDELTPDEERRAMWKHKAWRRITVMLAGPVTHFALAFLVLYLLATTLGLPNFTQKPVVQDVAPFLIADGQPAVIRAINKIGLERKGFDSMRIERVKAIYRILFRDGLNRTQALEKLAAHEQASTPEFERMLAFAKISERGLAPGA